MIGVMKSEARSRKLKIPVFWNFCRC